MNRLLLIVAMMLMIGVFSCSEEFLDRPPEDGFNVADFYRTNAEVEASTNALYTIPWFDFISNAAWPIAEITSGNAFTFDGRNADFVNFAVNENHQNIDIAWNSLYAVVAQANAVINTLPTAVGADVDDDVVNNALGEAHFIRAVAYFYLVRIFGPVPIIENNTEAIEQLELLRNPVADVYTLITRDLQFAMANCYDRPRSLTNYQQNGRVVSASAKSMLAKVYLYQRNYAEAYRLANEVIESGSFKLFGGDAEDGDPSGSYYDLFRLVNDNNPESIFALQWGTSGLYSEGNSVQSFFAQAGVTGFADGWSAAGPSLDLQDAYEDKDNDIRFYTTIQTPGNFYPDINGGFTVPSTIDFHNTDAGIKKYVIGAGAGAQQSYPNNIYIMRYADLLLIHAEAALLGGGDLTAGITSLNKVRRRAGLVDIATPTMDDIFRERRLELAFEFEFWFDVVRRNGVEGFDALEFLSDTERGFFSNEQPIEVVSQKFTATESDLYFPYPITELLDNPGLSKDPVPYNFGD